MARGMELPLNAIVLLIIALIVLLIVTLYLSGSGKQMFSKLSGLGEEAATQTEAGSYGAEIGIMAKLGWGAGECKTNDDCKAYTKCTGKTCTCEDKQCKVA